MKSRMKEICARTAEFYHTQLMRGRGEGPDAARKYLASRGFGGEVPKKWMLGYAPGRGALVRHLSALGFKPDEMIRANVALDGRGGPVRDRFYERVMFPIFDAQGDCVAFGGPRHRHRRAEVPELPGNAAVPQVPGALRA